MSDQGPIPDRDANDFGLIETLLWTRDGGFDLLPEHLARLSASSAKLGFRYDEKRTEAALAATVVPFSEDHAPAPSRPQNLRVRLVLSRDGAIETGATPIEPIPPETVWRVARAARRFSSADPLLRHKTTRRAIYEDELARVMNSVGADETLFLNERDELCESARCNLFAPHGDQLLTPPVSCGLLPGTLRANLIAQGRAHEAILHLENLPDEFFLGNSVRGLVRARLID